MKESIATFFRKTPDRLYESKGFTLIEVALAILIIGLIMTPLLALYNVQYKQRMINESTGRLNDIAIVLDNYAKNYDRYPLPASFLTSQADAEHGMEGTTPDICPDVTTNGFCLLEDPLNPDDAVYIGAVPFAELRMESDMGLDSWGNKILYAVARVQTDVTTFDIQGSGVIIEHALDWPSGNPTAQPGGYDAYLVSFGEKGKGAYSAEGILLSDCLEPGNPTYEDENCDFSNAIFLSDVNRGAIPTPFGAEDLGTRSYVEGVPEYYDDVTLAIQRPEIGDWNENINDPLLVTTIKNRVGIGEGAINPEHGLDVDGDVLIERDPTAVDDNGRLVTAEICTGDGRCFRPIDIYGDQDDMECDDNNVPGVEPVIGIGTSSGNAQVFCASTINESGTPIIDQFSDPDGTTRWGAFRLNGITFNNTAGGSTNCASTGQNVGSITGTGTGNITCVTPF